MAFQDHEENTRGKAARIWTIVVLLLAAGCASGPAGSVQLERMRLYRKYYNDLTPAQRREYLSGKFDSPAFAEQKLQGYARANRTSASLLGRRDQMTSGIEQVWRRAEKYLAEAEKSAGGPAATPQKTANLEGGYQELLAALKRAEGKIRHAPYSAIERSDLLSRNSYYLSRLQAVHKLLSKSR